MQTTQCSVEDTGSGSIIATARAWGKLDDSKQILKSQQICLAHDPSKV